MYNWICRNVKVVRMIHSNDQVCRYDTAKACGIEWSKREEMKGWNNGKCVLEAHDPEEVNQWNVGRDQREEVKRET